MAAADDVPGLLKAEGWKDGPHDGPGEHDGDPPDRWLPVGRVLRGKSIHFGVDVVDQQSQQEMGVDPGLDQTLVPGPQTVDPEDRFQALEAEFDLPAQAVQGGELGAGNVGIAQRGDQDEMPGGGQGARIDPAVLALAMGAARRLEGVGGGLGGLGRITRRRRTGGKRPRALWSSTL